MCPEFFYPVNPANPVEETFFGFHPRESLDSSSPIAACRDSLRWSVLEHDDARVLRARLLGGEESRSFVRRAELRQEQVHPECAGNDIEPAVAGDVDQLK